MLLNFFHAWDGLEMMHPFGVPQFFELMYSFGVPANLARRLDACLFMDLMYSQRPSVRRIKLEHRATHEVAWAYVDFVEGSAAVSFQRSPNAPFVYTTSVDPTPPAIMEAILQYFRTSVRAQRCVRGGDKRQRLE